MKHHKLPFMKIVKQIARILVGLTFIFSGFVKGIDPLGSSYKFHDYFNAMGMEWLVWAALPLGILLAFSEFTIGAGLLFNVKIPVFSWLALLFMIFFTGLTLWIALENPVTDCGCFGDALVISNWETFYKNVVLIALTLIIFIHRKSFEDVFPGRRFNYLLALIFMIGYISIVFYSYNHLPVIDFLPYKIGVNIPEAMKIPSDAEHDVYKNIFYYKNKNTGEIKKFDEQNYPWQDTLTWEYSDSESILVKKGYEPPIHDFIIQTPEGDNIADFFLYDKNYVFILIAYDINRSGVKNQEEINNLANWAIENKYSFICLTSSLRSDIENFVAKTGAPYEFFNCDEIALKSVLRSNPGLMLIKEGTIMDKWHHNDIPTPEKFKKKFLNE